MFDLIAIGDTTIDVFLELTEDEVAVEQKEGSKTLLMEFGTKLPVTKMTRLAAVGNAANNAIGSARLGLKSAIYTVLGEEGDLDSDEHVDVFREEGVALDYVIREKGTKSNFSVVINVGAERTILVFHEERTYDLPHEIVPAKWIYFTSLGKNHQELHTDIPTYLEQTGAKFAFQPGSHQLREGLVTLKPLIGKADFLVMNKEEAQELLGMKEECVSLVNKFLELGAKTVAVTDGEKGSFASDGNGVWFQDIYEVPVIERTGCGDAYATGFVAALSHELAVTEAMRWGTVNAAGVLGFIGAREGLMTREQIQDKLAQKEGFGPVRV